MGSLLYQLLMQLDIDAWSWVFSRACFSVSSISYCIEFVGTKSSVKTRVVYFRKWCGDVSLKTSQTLEIYISGYSFFIIARHHCIFSWCHELRTMINSEGRLSIFLLVVLEFFWNGRGRGEAGGVTVFIKSGQNFVMGTWQRDSNYWWILTTQAWVDRHLDWRRSFGALAGRTGSQSRRRGKPRRAR